MLTVLEEAAKRVGGVPELARRLGVTRQAIDQWVEVPLERVAELSATTGLPRETFRPDAFGAAAAPSDYERDFHAWAERQAGLFAAGRFDELDRANLAEEIGDLSASLRREVKSRLTVVLAHLLKWAYQPSARSSSWRGSLDENRDQIEVVLEDNPSLASLPAAIMTSAYSRARRNAARETGLLPETFPASCPFTVAQALDHEFLPEPRA